MSNSDFQIFTLMIKQIGKYGMTCLKAMEAPCSLIFAIWPCQHESWLTYSCTASCAQKLRQKTDLIDVLLPSAQCDASNSWKQCNHLFVDLITTAWEIRKRWDGCHMTLLPSCRVPINQLSFRFQTADEEKLPIQLSSSSSSPLKTQPLVTLAGSQRSNHEKKAVLFLKDAVFAWLPRNSPQAAICFSSSFLSCPFIPPLIFTCFDSSFCWSTEGSWDLLRWT